MKYIGLKIKSVERQGRDFFHEYGTLCTRDGVNKIKFS
jgi:hypothetical protein